MVQLSIPFTHNSMHTNTKCKVNTEAWSLFIALLTSTYFKGFKNEEYTALGLKNCKFHECVWRGCVDGHRHLGFWLRFTLQLLSLEKAAVKVAALRPLVGKGRTEILNLPRPPRLTSIQGKHALVLATLFSVGHNYQGFNTDA